MVDDDDEEEISTTGHESPSELKRIDSIQFGLYEIDSWYWSPYLDDDQTTTKLYICEYCLRYFKYKKNYEQHTTNGCTRYQPPGRKIYEHPNGLSVFEVDGQTAQLYCQCLCLLAKLFLDRKTIYFDVEGFLFYVLAKLDDNKRNTYHLLGYFSKEKFSDEGYNLACLMVLPPHQRQGYGKFLIALSEFKSITGDAKVLRQNA
ncbi:unnamed protein product [Didymodactylos carnosus]|uniref:MYST-type HAT domain-containing protein n=1 Tax=Didymodactylos carnosus TaxID=1234261 RepID=A0A8S2FM47_9BILA|nr:unnamed protein product [Didymodactylos carnosus]CAF4290366.1 unnamed protein product [Didymodactylos carnosus]